MKKVAIVGVEGSGKTVMLAGLGDLYTYPDEQGYFLSPKNFSTAAYVAEKIERMRNGEWPTATPDDVMEGLDWTLKRSVPGERRRPEAICEISFLDFAGEVYRTAFGIGAGSKALSEQAEELKRYVREADDLIVLINLRDVIVHGARDKRVQEAAWITKAILDVAHSEKNGHKPPRAAIVLSQADSYADTIKVCGGAAGVLKKYLPHVANSYEWLDIFSVSTVDKTRLDDDGKVVPAADFTTKGLVPVIQWICDGVTVAKKKARIESLVLPFFVGVILGVILVLVSLGARLNGRYLTTYPSGRLSFFIGLVIVVVGLYHIVRNIRRRSETSHRCPSKNIAIVGVEGSGKTVMLAGLGDLYTYPDEQGYFLSPENFSTAAYVAEKIERMRNGDWPTATPDDVMEGLDWTLKRSVPGERRRPEEVCEISFLDFAGEVYRTAFGIGAGNKALSEQAEELKRYVREADDLIVLINLRDVIVNGLGDKRVQEAMWITKAILDTVIPRDDSRRVPRAAIVLSQADSYADSIKACGGASGVLKKYLPHVANSYGWLDVFSASAVDKTRLDDDGNIVPAADFTTQGLLPILKWIRGELVKNKVWSRSCVIKAILAAMPFLFAGLVSWLALIYPQGARVMAEWDERVRRGGDLADNWHTKVQLWENGPYWADTNIGADKPWEYGYYFWWGETVGYKLVNNIWVASDGSSSGFSFQAENTLTRGKSADELKSEGWITIGNVLAQEYDAAHVQWGGKWRMPTCKELWDLCNKCEWTWTSMNGVNGYVVRGRGVYASASIFLPAAGYGNGTSLHSAGSLGYYWSSVPNSDHSDAWYLYFNSGYHYTNYDRRSYGQSVRPVQGFTK